jgi:threonine dehydrogenase-like Zn-dependent dehydrogenase
LSEYKTNLLNKIGAAIAPLEEPLEFLKEHFGELPQRQSGTAINVDIVVDCAGVPNIIEQFFQMAKEDSTLSVVGIGHAEQGIPLGRLTSSEMNVIGSSGYNQSDIEEVINNLASQKTFAKDIITHHFPLEQLNEAINTAADRDTAIKVVIDME